METTDWDARYDRPDYLFGTEPTLFLREHAGFIAPESRVLCVADGEGRNAVWLAGQGWQVTALDVSEVALERTRRHAEEAELGGRVTTLHHDLLGDGVPTGVGPFDLVSVFFLHLPRPDFDDLHRGLAAMVAPGGSLLVVGHHPDDLETGVRRPHGPDLLFPPERLVAVLDETEWDVVVADAPTREVDRGEGPVTLRDTVVRAVRALPG